MLYIAFAHHFKFVDFPATEESLLCYAEFLTRSYRAHGSVYNALASLRRLQAELHFDLAPFQAPQLAAWKRALPLTTRHVPFQAPPLPVELLNQLTRLAQGLGEQGQVFSALLALCFYSMARLSSLLPADHDNFDPSRLPTLNDVTGDTGGGFRLRIKWAKNLQFASDTFTVPLTRIQGSPACPVTCLIRLLQLLAGAPRSVPLFSFHSQSQGGRAACRRSFTMRTARQWLKYLLRALGQSEHGYTFHSLRRGACTLAFRNGADEAALQAMGGWRSAAVQIYYAAEDRRARVAAALRGPLLT